jgi:putative transposase
MAKHAPPLNELLEKAGRADLLSGVAESVLQLLMEADVEALINAGRHKRSDARLNSRNGYRKRILATRLGPLSLRIPKLRRGSYFPPFLEDCRTTERVLLAVIQETWTGGVSTQRINDLVQAMGLGSISKTQIAELCKEVDVRVRAFLDVPSLWLDTALQVRQGETHHHRH